MMQLGKPAWLKTMSSTAGRSQFASLCRVIPIVRDWRASRPGAATAAPVRRRVERIVVNCIVANGLWFILLEKWIVEKLRCVVRKWFRVVKNVFIFYNGQLFTPIL